METRRTRQIQVGKHLAALVMPFKSNLILDEKALRRACQHVLKADGIEGLVVNVHVSEVDSLSTVEQVSIVEIFGEEAHAKIIGEVIADHLGRVTMSTGIGGTRIINMPLGELLPRIC
jgi:dihydrodipicolinate synthase/N-acetylneuraminate lyase